MNWKIIFGLSLFGLVMAFSTIYFIPSNVEIYCWLAIFVLCAYLIARYAPSRPFWHGFLVSLCNAVWVTAVHIILFDIYLANHAREARMMSKISMADHPQLMLLATGPIIGVLSGVVLGFFALIARKLVKK